MKHYTVSIYEKPPKGGFLRYEGILAENRKDLKEKLKARNSASKDEYIPLKSAFTLG